MDKKYIALITSSPTVGVPPTLKVRQNTIGAIEWSNPDNGVIVGFGVGLFPEDTTLIELEYQAGNGIKPVSNPAWTWWRGSDDQINIRTDELDGQLTDHLLIITILEPIINYQIP